MRPFLLLCVAILNLALSSAALAQAPQENWEGYRTVPDAQLPRSLQTFARTAIFQMISVGATVVANDTFEIVIVNANTPVTNARTNYRSLQIETCRKQNLIRCPVTVNARADTIFLNNGKYYSCRHLFHNWLQRASAENNRAVKDLIVPAMIVDANYKVVYNSAYSPSLTFDFLQTNPAANVPHSNSGYDSPERRLFKLFDIVSMTTSQQFGVDAKLAETSDVKSDIQKTDAVYLLGYPDKTQQFINGVGDAPGNQVMVSHGIVDHSYTGPETTFMTSAFNTGGISGGPVVTENGLILGIHCTREAPLDSGMHPDLVKSIPYPLNMDYLAKLWEDMGYPIH